MRQLLPSCQLQCGVTPSLLEHTTETLRTHVPVNMAAFPLSPLPWFLFLLLVLEKLESHLLPSLCVHSKGGGRHTLVGQAVHTGEVQSPCL